jgi:tetratricopeptide (TPR) repeat protein
MIHGHQKEEGMNRNQTLLAALCIGLAALTANAASLTLPRDSQAASVSRMIGLVKVTVDYSSPRVHAPNGEDRHGKIWGKLVPYGMTNLGFGTCKDCPWRAGANENTVITVSHDIDVEGQKLAAGSYGLHMIPGENEFTVIFSKNSAAWGSFFYDPAEDVLRVKVKPAKSDYQEALSYDFTDATQDQATLALRWEELQVPIRIAVHDSDALYMAALRNELRSEPGFQFQNWVQASQYALKHKHNEEALDWAQAAVSRQFIGKENFQTLNALADAQEATGKVAEAKASREKALNDITAGPIDLHQYARQLLAKGQKQEALRIWQLNAKKHPNEWPVNAGLARGYSANGDYKQALKYAKLAANEAPDPLNKKSMEDAVKKLEQNQDIN